MYVGRGTFAKCQVLTPLNPQLPVHMGFSEAKPVHTCSPNTTRASFTLRCLGLGEKLHGLPFYSYLKRIYKAFTIMKATSQGQG